MTSAIELRYHVGRIILNGVAILRAAEFVDSYFDAWNQRDAKLVAEQVFDNARVAAGALDDPREMVGRIHDILEIALQNETPGTKRVTT